MYCKLLPNVITILTLILIARIAFHNSLEEHFWVLANASLMADMILTEYNFNDTSNLPLPNPVNIPWDSFEPGIYCQNFLFH